MSKPLEGKNIVLTGSTGRLGRQILSAFSNTGASLITVDRSINMDLVDRKWTRRTFLERGCIFGSRGLLTDYGRTTPSLVWLTDIKACVSVSTTYSVDNSKILLNNCCNIFNGVNIFKVIHFQTVRRFAGQSEYIVRRSPTVRRLVRTVTTVRKNSQNR